jgi:hypothetical protein
MNGKETLLTIPIASSRLELIKDSLLVNKRWVRKHKEIIRNTYCKHPHYNYEIINGYYAGAEEIMDKTGANFADVVIHLVLNLCTIFGFKPNVLRSSHYCSADNLTGPLKLRKICEEAGASTYISGTNGRDYKVKDAFSGSGIEVAFHDYKYPEYKQYNQEIFVPWLSFFDPLFNLGIEEVKKWIYQKPEFSLE